MHAAGINTANVNLTVEDVAAESFLKCKNTAGGKSIFFSFLGILVYRSYNQMPH